MLSVVEIVFYSLVALWNPMMDIVILMVAANTQRLKIR